MLNKRDVPAPSLPESVVSVQELSGEVLVRGLLLKDRLDIAVADDGFGRMSRMLAACVFVSGPNGAMVQLYTAEEWERWGAKNYTAAMNLWDVARKLSGFDEEAEKKSSAQNSDSPSALQ